MTRESLVMRCNCGILLLPAIVAEGRASGNPTFRLALLPSIVTLKQDEDPFSGVRVNEVRT